MNSILMIVIAIVILLLVFVMFSLDDQEEEADFLQEEEREKIDAEPKADAASKLSSVESVSSQEAEDQPASVESVTTPVAVKKIRTEPQKIQESGTEEDLRFRILLDQRFPVCTALEEMKGVAAAVQIRFPEEIVTSGEGLVKLIQRAEAVFDKDFSFPFTSFPSAQLDRILFFDKSDTRDDELFEALVVAFEVVSRFKKMLESDQALREAKARIAIGLSMGSIVKVKRGLVADPSWLGKAIYLAETYAEAAADFAINVDDQIHKAALPLFDFCEWKPVKMRSPLPPLPFYVLVGWNKPEEISAYAASKDIACRRAVAVAYRYLELDEIIQPLLEMLSDTEERVALEALETIKVIGNESALGHLKRIFPETQEANFRSAIIDAFASIGKSEVVPVILGSTKESSWKVRLSAGRALFRLSGQESLRHLDHLLSDSDAAVKAGVNGIFYRATGKSQYLQALGELLQDLSGRARKVAVEELLQSDSDEVVRLLVDNFVDQDFDMQKMILRRFESSRSKILYQSFLTLFKISGEKVRPHIVEAVRRAGLVS
ncbi:MAG: HEAT repeat domain-containing protein [Candidatus Rifleibacteriota bacterium]